MEIIRKGKLPEDQTYQGECLNCRTVVRFFKAEGEVILDKRDGNCIRVSCPLCDQDIYVNL